MDPHGDGNNGGDDDDDDERRLLPAARGDGFSRGGNHGAPPPPPPPPGDNHHPMPPPGRHFVGFGGLPPPQLPLQQLIDEQQWVELHGIAAEPYLSYGNMSEANQARERERIQQERGYLSRVCRRFFREDEDDGTGDRPLQQSSVELQWQERLRYLKEWKDDVVQFRVNQLQEDDTNNSAAAAAAAGGGGSSSSHFVILANLAVLASQSDVCYFMAVHQNLMRRSKRSRGDDKENDRDDSSTSTPRQQIVISLEDYSRETVLVFLVILTEKHDDGDRDDDDTSPFSLNPFTTASTYSLDEIPSEHAVDCARLAHFLQCNALLDQLVHEILIPSLDSHNCASFCQLAYQLNLPNLQEAATNHMLWSLDKLQQEDQPGSELWNEYLTPDLQAKILNVQKILRSTNRKQIFFGTIKEYLAMLAEQHQYYRERLEEALEEHECHSEMESDGWAYVQDKIDAQRVKVERLRQFLEEQRRLFGGFDNCDDAADKEDDDNESRNDDNQDASIGDGTIEEGGTGASDNADDETAMEGNESGTNNNHQAQSTSSIPPKRRSKRRCAGSVNYAGMLLCICIFLSGLSHTVTSTPFVYTPTRPFGLIQRRHQMKVISAISHVRGGALDEYDEYDDEEEEDYKAARPTRPRSSKKSQASYDHSMIDLPPDRAQASRDGRPLRKQKKQPHWSQRLATSSLQMTGQLAWNTLVKQPSKLAYHVIRPKYVDIRETDGLWRLEQQVTERGGKELGSVATIELQSRSRLLILRKEEQPPKGDGSSDKPKVMTIKEPYTFTKKKLTGSFQTQFVAPAFLIGENQMRLYGYRGTWQRKLADKRIIKLVGKIYQVHKQRFGKQRGEYVFGQPVGTFVARRRIKARIEDDDIDEFDEYDEEVDGEEWEDVDGAWDEDEEEE